jgi:hypothetical protein
MKLLLPLLFLLSVPVQAQSGPATVQDYGQSCHGAQLVSALVKIGRDHHVAVNNVNATVCVLVIGSEALFLPAPHFPNHGCMIHAFPISEAHIHVFASANGRADINLGEVPNDVSLIGTKLFMQATGDDSPGPSWTQGVEALIGG